MQWLQRERDKNKGGTVLNIWKSETVIYETQKKNLIQTYLLYQLDSIVPFRWLDGNTSPIDQLG